MAVRSRIFMSYRRSDSLTATGRLYDQLCNWFDAKYIFKDMENIPAGKDYRTVLEEELRTCSVILIIIGNSWLTITDSDGKRRLNNPDDPVRLEVEMALARKDASVIPLLVEGASLPKAEDLPDSLREMHYRNAVKVRHDPDFKRDVEDLIKQIKAVSTIDEEIRHGKMIRRGLAALVALLVVLLLGALALLLPAFRDGIPVSALTDTALVVAPTLEPVVDGEIMVAVAQFEPLRNPSERDVARFIVADLKRNLEKNRVSDKIRIRQYAGIIRSSDEAQQVANSNQAAIIIWGNYTPEYVTVNLEIGNLSQFKNIKLERSTIEVVTNVQARMTDEQSQSLAVNVLEIALSIQTADSNLYEAMVNITSASLIQVTNPELMGNTVSANLHRAILSYFTNSQEALKLTAQALELDPTNVLALLFRSLLYFRMGNNDAALTDHRTATRLSPNGWTAPAYLQFLYDFTFKNYQKSIEEIEPVIAAQPDQWYPYYIRAMEYYFLTDYKRAQDDLDKALALNPTTNFPYLLQIYLELRAGNVTKAKVLYDESIHKFPDYTFGGRMTEIVSGNNINAEFKGGFDMFSNLMFERYEDAKEAATVMLNEGLTKSEFYIGRAFAECSTNEYKKAIDDLNLAEKLDDKNVLLYLLRAQSRFQMKDLIGATQDIGKARSLSTDPNFPYVIQLAMSGKLSCQNYFDVVLPTAQPSTTPTA